MATKSVDDEDEKHDVRQLVEGSMLLEQLYGIERCYKELRPWFFKRFLILCKDQCLADDFADEAFFHILRKLEECSPAKYGGSGFIGWAKTVGCNKVKDLVKKANKRAEIFRQWNHSLTAADAPTQDAAEVAEVRRLIEAALSELTDAERQVFVLHDVDGLSHADVSLSLDIEVGASRRRLHRARAKLRPLLAAYDPRPPLLRRTRQLKTGSPTQSVREHE